ncbi:MAG: hypothetical protein R3F43_05745 [bacterium]
MQRGRQRQRPRDRLAAVGPAQHHRRPDAARPRLRLGGQGLAGGHHALERQLDAGIGGRLDERREARALGLLDVVLLREQAIEVGPAVVAAVGERGADEHGDQQQGRAGEEPREVATHGATPGAGGRESR